MNMKQIVNICHLLYDRMLVSGYDGNISIKLSNCNIAITKSKVNKRMITTNDIIVCDLNGKVISVNNRVSKEFDMHKNIYLTRPDVNAIIHTHAAYTTAFAVCGQPLPENYLIETKVILKGIELVPYAPPGSMELAKSVIPFVKDADVLLLENHGVVSCGANLMEAYNNLDMTENVAKTIIMAKILGEPKTINYKETGKL